MENNCENCGAKIEENSKFCPECGAQVKQDSNTCPNCGESIENSVNFCENCGTDLNAPQTETKKESVLEQYKIPIIIITTVAIIMLICVITFSMTAHNDSSSDIDYGTQTVNVGNIKFEIPGNYRLVPTSIDYDYQNFVSSYTQSYSDGHETITVGAMYSPGANVDASSVLDQTGGGVPKTMMGRTGYYYETSDGYAFFTGIGNKIVVVVVSSPYLFDEIKILG